MIIPPSKVNIVCFNGPPYVGKDTQAKLLVANDPTAVHFSPGAILRECAESKKGYREYFDFDIRKLRADLTAGKLVDGVVLAQGLERMLLAKLDEGKSKFFYAGWPREEASLSVLLNLVLTLRSENVDVDLKHIYLKASEEELWTRFNAGVSSKRNRGRESRKDDTPEGFRSRIDIFNSRTLPFMKRHKLDFGYTVVESGETAHRTQERTLRALGLPPQLGVEGQFQPNPRARR